MGKSPITRSARETSGVGPAREARSAFRAWVNGPPSRAFVVALTAAACAVIVHLGVPSPGVSPGDRAPKTFVARVRFTAVDGVKTDQNRQIERERTLSVYSENKDWQQLVLRTVRALVEATRGSPDLDAARVRLSAAGIDIDPAPVWEYVRAEGESILLKTRRIVAEIESAGVLSPERMEIEGRSGRRCIRRGDREALLALAGRKGVVDVDAARESAARELRAAYGGHPKLAGTLAQAIFSDLGPSLIYEEQRTRALRDEATRAVRDVEVDVSQGTLIVAEGERIGQTEYAYILREAATYYAGRSVWFHVMLLAGTFAIVAVIAGALGASVVRLEPGALSTVRSVFFAGVFNILVVAAARGLVVGGLPVLLAPAVLASIVFALTVSPLFAVLNAVALAAVTGLAAGPDYAVPLALAAGAVIGAHAAARARRRSELLRAGALAGVVQCLAVVAMKVGTGVEEVPVLLQQGGWALVGGFGCGLLSLGLMPAAEVAFGVTTDISLLELSDQNHPALRRLLVEAPGSYHHSMIVGNLSEAAANALGANALLARVASYYHDLGKVDRPEYFIENEPAGRSRHENLAPTMSTLIITSHVRDGVALGAQYGLPSTILDIIAQHHGTSLVEFFYRAAIDRLSEESQGGESVDEQLFRYAGPKPRTREAAIVLLADTVEAASRTLAEPTSARLSKLVHDLTMKRLLDGQFDESDLTLRDLRVASDVFVKVLASMFHTRVQYPAVPAPPGGQPLSGAAR